jgi:hypothetical protein
MPVYGFVILIVAAVTIIICTATDRRLALAALGVGGGYALIVFSQLVLGLSEPHTVVLTALLDLVALGLIGNAVKCHKWPSGVHLAGLCMCVSLVAHPAYNLVGNATFAYYVLTNGLMVVACLGLISSALVELVGRYGSADNPRFSRARWVNRLAQRREPK